MGVSPRLSSLGCLAFVMLISSACAPDLGMESSNLGSGLNDSFKASLQGRWDSACEKMDFSGDYIREMYRFTGDQMDFKSATYEDDECRRPISHESVQGKFYADAFLFSGIQVTPKKVRMQYSRQRETDLANDERWCGKDGWIRDELRDVSGTKCLRAKFAKGTTELMSIKNGRLVVGFLFTRSFNRKKARP